MSPALRAPPRSWAGSGQDPYRLEDDPLGARRARGHSPGEGERLALVGERRLRRDVDAKRSRPCAGVDRLPVRVGGVLADEPPRGVAHGVQVRAPRPLVVEPLLRRPVPHQRARQCRRGGSHPPRRVRRGGPPAGEPRGAGVVRGAGGDPARFRRPPRGREPTRPGRRRARRTPAAPRERRDPSRRSISQNSGQNTARPAKIRAVWLKPASCGGSAGRARGR